MAETADNEDMDSWTPDAPTNVLEPKNVSIQSDPQNPAHGIIVEWQKPEVQTEINHFDVHLVDQRGKQLLPTISVKMDQPTRVTFRNAKSETAYRGCVTTVIENPTKKSKRYKEYSAFVTTAKASTIPGFKIRLAGKPTISVCKATAADDGYIGYLEWTSPDIDIEKHNYELTFSVTFVEKTQSKSISLELKDDNCINPVALKSGKNYIFTVKSTYRHIDTHNVYAVEASQELITAIKEPCIRSIDWEKELILINWKMAEGALNHTLKILDDRDNEIDRQNVNDTQKTMSYKMTRSCRYGMSCSFVIEAHGPNNEILESKRRITVGGDTVVTNVTAEIVEKRQILVKWQEPKSKANNYEICISEVDAKGKKTTVTTATSCELRYLFKQLKSKTLYQFSVRPMPQYGMGDLPFSESEKIRTPERVDEAIEKDDKFGMPRDIVVKTLENIGGQCKIQVMWTSVHAGSNYIVLNYHVKLSNKKWMGLRKKIHDESDKLDPKTTFWTSIPIQAGHQYDIILSTTLLNLDSCEEEKYKTDEVEFAGPQKIVMIKTELSQEEITFRWDERPDVESFKIIVQDDLQKTTLINHDTEENTSSYQVPLTKDLRVGQTYFVKVKAFNCGKTICESDWKNFFIGDDKCPRNVKASHRGDLVRSLDIVFDLPRKGPAPKYKIVAVPADQRGIKTEYTSSAMYTFCYLRSDTKYHFEISATWNENFSRSSRSNDITTNYGIGTSGPFCKVDGARDVNLSIANNTVLNINSSKQVNHHSEPHFGIVRDLKVEHHDEMKYHDNVKISWESALFEEDEDSNYRLITYRVEYQKGTNKGQLKEVKNGNSCFLELELGFIYTVHVKTKFEIIDSCIEKYSESCKEQVYTRPSKPRIYEPEIDFHNDELLVKWAAADGAKSFRVMIHTNKSERPVLDDSVGREYIYRKKFDDKLGYGMTFFAKVMAYGERDLTNTAETEELLIGGDRVPSNVRACNNNNNEQITDPSTQVHVSWIASELPPQSYQLEVYSCSERKSVRKEYGIKENHFLVTELKAGFNYVFKVHAVHNGSPTSGCLSNEVNTRPVPMRVKNVKAKPGDDASTTGIVEWDEILEEEKKDEIKYCVYLSSPDNSTIRQEETDKHIISFMALQPATSYHVKVHAFNLKGSGRWSEECSFKTDFHKPRNVTLDLPQDDFRKRLRLRFQPANGSPLRHVCELIRHTAGGDDAKEPKLLKNGQDTVFFVDFEANQLYSAVVYAVFNDDTGEQSCTASNKIRTNPSKAHITALECYGKDDKGSTQFVVGWDKMDYIEYYEVSIMRGASSETENVFFVQKDRNKVIYSCQYEASEYFVQVRAKNETGFGDLSTKENVKLAPSKLRGIHAELGINGEMVVTCESTSDTSISYWMTALCKDERVQECIRPSSISNKIKWVYTPKKPATPHVFELWAENSKGDKSQRARSEQIMSKPTRASKPTLKIVTDSDGFPTTNITISWKELYGCDYYIVKVLWANNTPKEQSHDTREERLENCLKSTGTHTVYNCSSPGSIYRVKICGVAGSSRGDWSEKSEVKLVPDKVHLIEAVTNTPMEKIYIRWKKLVVAPDGYRIQVFRENERDPAEDKKFLNDVTEYTVRRDELIPGNRYYYQVSAYNETSQGLELGIPTTSKQIVIAWKLPRLDITPDEANPYHRAKIEWEKPEGVNFYELEIQNKEHGTVYKKRLEDVLSYVFEDGLPGNVYSVRLYCGYHCVRDENCVEKTMIMHPLPPSNIKVTADQVNTRLIVEFSDNPLFYKEYIIQWKCLSKGFEHTQISDPIKEHRYLVSGLKPGALYEIAVLTVVTNTKSQYAYCSNLVQTLPAIVEQLGSKQNDDGSIMFGWDHLGVHPSEYIVQWKMNNKDVIEQSTVENIVLIHDPEPGSCYSFRVKAMNRSGGGRFSDWNAYFTTPLPPTDIKVTADQDNCRLLVTFMDTPSFHKEYETQYRCLSPGFEETKQLKGIKDHFAVLYDLVPGALYEVAVRTVVSNKQSSYAYSNSNTETLPSQIQNVRAVENGDGTILFEWDQLNPPPFKYNVLWKLNNQHVHKESTLENSFCVYNPEPQSCYNICVEASNNSGCGKLFGWYTYITNPSPPSNIKVAADQDNTRLIVEFNDTPSSHKEYIIQWRCLSKGFEDTQTSDPIKEHRYLVSGLKPGAQYEIAVLTVVSNANSQYEYCSNIVHTLPPIVERLRYKQNDDGSIFFGWDHLGIRPSEYIVQWKMNDKDLIEQSTVENTILIHDPEAGSCYSFRVKAINSSGGGGFSDWNGCLTRPDCPAGLSAECLSPVLVKIWCDPVKHASSYIFNVNGDCCKRVTPLLEFKNNKDTETLQINVCASIEKMSGLPSKTLLFKQTLLHLKKKFERIAKNRFTYLPLTFQNLATGDQSICFQSGLSVIEKGETCLVVGEYSTGKTATCCHCIENLDDGQLGMYLDYEDFRGDGRNMSVETVIGEYMKDLHDGEISSVLKWMKENSELVVLFVENLSLPTEYTSKIIQYGDVTGKEHIFYNLSSTRREIFPDARIICTTCYKHMDTILHPTSALQVLGCCDEQIQDVTKEIFAGDKEDFELREAIQYFCINPFYRSIILKLVKMRHRLDLKNFSDVVIELLEESMNRLSYERRIVRLEEFRAAILHFQSQGFLIPAMTSQDLSCKRLHDDVMKALYFGYFCSSKVFESVFKEKYGIVVPLTSGILEKERTKRLEELFRPNGEPSVDVHKKVGKLKEYLSKQMKQMHKHAPANHRVALNLLQSSIELGHTNMADSTIKLKISSSLESREVNEVALFLAKVQDDFCPRIQVKLKGNISNDITETINNGIKKNSFTKENPTKTIPIASGKMEFRIWERSTDLTPIASTAEKLNELPDRELGEDNPLLSDES